MSFLSFAMRDDVPPKKQFIMKINARGKFEKIEVTQEIIEQRSEQLNIVENKNLNWKTLRKPVGNLFDKGNSPENVKF